MNRAIVTSSWRLIFGAAIFAALFALPFSRTTLADKIPAGWEASNMKPIGYSDLNGHGAFKMAIKRAGDKW